jgi:formate dehydrogenase major subunit
MTTITIDGKILDVPEGTTVLRAAQNNGIEIPTLCDHPHLTPYGGCRLCLVEVEGYRTLQPSCTLPVSNNMVIKTDTKKVLDARKFVLTLIFSERNHFCPYCQVSGGDCELQNAAYNEGMTHWPLQPNWQRYSVDASHPYIILENNRCILCRRCVRACGELVGNYTLGFEERGARSILVADTGVPLGESTCISCGSCVQVCPTGALIDRWSAYQGHEVKLESTKTICVGCSLGCGIEVFTRDNRLVKINGDWDHPLNAGVICEVGRFEPFTGDCDRIHTPMVRKDGTLKAATWDEAISAIATSMVEARGSIFTLISTRQPVETMHTIKQLFEDGLQAELVTSTEEGQFTNTAAVFADRLGQPFETDLADLATANGVLLLGVDLVKEHQVAGFFIKRNLASGTNLVVIDSALNDLDVHANKVLKPSANRYEDVLKAISAAIVKLGLAKGHTSIKADELISLAAITGVSTDDYLDAAFILASAVDPVIVYNQQMNLSVLKDFASVIGAKLISLKGDANSLAASQFGLDKPYTKAEYKAAFIALGDDEISQKSVTEIEKIPFKVVQACYTSSLTAGADVILPATTWLEQGGHYLNASGTIQKAVKSLQPEEDVFTIGETLLKIADKAGVKLAGDCHKTLHHRIAPVEIGK